MFTTYLELGFNHILDVKGYDHMLFLLALCAMYTIKDWKKILILVTAFTIGHSVTLAFSALSIWTVSSDLIEFLIPTTILITAIYQAIRPHEETLSKMVYGITLLFGLIHGMGFSNYFKALLGSSGEIVTPLLAFNIGVELGQIIIVILITTIAYILIDLLGACKKDWTLFISGAAAGVALLLMSETKFW